MSKESERSEFEAWRKTLMARPNLMRVGDYYEDYDTQIAWSGFQAARASQAAAPAEAREPHFIAKLDFGEGLVVVQECTLDDAPSIAIYGSLSQGTPGESAKAEPSPTDPKIARRSVFLTFLDSAHRDRVADALVGVPADAGEAVAWTSVDDHLPPDETDVLVKKMRGSELYYDIAGIFHGDWMSQVTGNHCNHEVTHWRPIESDQGAQGGKGGGA